MHELCGKGKDEHVCHKDCIHKDLGIWLKNDSEQNCTTVMLCFFITFSAYLH